MFSSWSGSPACLYLHCATKVGLQPFFCIIFSSMFSLIPSLQLCFNVHVPSFFPSETPGMDLQCRHLETMLFMILVGRWHTRDPVLSAVSDVMFGGTVCRHCHKLADLTVCDKWRDIHKACSGKIDRLMDRQPVLLLCTLCSFETLNASFCKEIIDYTVMTQCMYNLHYVTVTDPITNLCCRTTLWVFWWKNV